MKPKIPVCHKKESTFYQKFHSSKISVYSMVHQYFFQKIRKFSLKPHLVHDCNLH